MALTKSRPAVLPAGGMAQPAQARSRESLDRMLEALEGLLKARSFDKITIAEIALRAGVSVGSIYVRFADKPALLIGAHRRIHERSEPCRRRLTDPRTWRDHSLDQIASGLIQASIRYFRQHRGVLRAVAVTAPPQVFDMVAAEVDALNAALTDLVLAKAPAADPARVRRAVEAANGMVVSVLNFRIIHAHVAVLPAASYQRLAEELLVVTWAFLRPVLEETEA